MTDLKSRCMIAAAVMLFAAGAAQANDTAAELSIGGLKFIQSNDVTMKSEDLRISLNRISVSYRFVNTSAQPVTLTVAFPLPDIDLSESDNIALPTDDPVNFIGFETKIDGEAAAFTMEQHAKVGDKDVSALLHELKLPLLPIGPRELRVAALPEPTRKRLIDAGLLMPAGSDDKGRQQYSPAWTVQTSAVRQQTFPPNKEVAVDHSYRPSVGTSFDTMLRTPLRNNKAMAADVARYRRDYCVSDGFLAKLDKLTTGPQAMIGERRISYVLKTGANWAGPIKSFKLTIDAGAADRLVSFCAGTLKSSTAAALEFTAENFKPDRDLRFLLLGKF